MGHGFNLAMHPYLTKLYRDNEICIECCPISNFLLGYVRDFRTHPIKYLMAQGVPVSISPDDPGYFDYDGTTLDFVYAFLSWDLNLADLKNL